MIIPKRKKAKVAYTVNIKRFLVLPRPQTQSPRKKVNFMIDEGILARMKEWIPEGERSNFVNGALEEAVKDIFRKEASEFMDKVRKEGHFKMTDAQIRKAREYGRE